MDFQPQRMDMGPKLLIRKNLSVFGMLAEIPMQMQK